MSRKKASKRIATRAEGRPVASPTKMPRSRRLLAALCLGFVLMASADILSARHSSLLTGKPKQTQSQSSQVAPQSTTPSKQYIYAGGKLIATVEGTSSTPPPPPGGIVLNTPDVLPHRVALAWTYGGSGQEQFRVERNSGSGFTPAGYTAPTTLSFIDDNNPNGLSPGTYQYRVFAHSNVSGDSAPSNVVTAAMPGGPPAAPTSMTIGYNPAGPEVDLSWVPGDATETGFKVERAPAGGSFTQIATVCQSPATYADKPVSGPAGFTYQVKAYNAFGDSAPLTSGIINIPPPAPGASMVSCGTSVQISWTESAAVDTFTVLRNGTQIASGITPTPPTTTYLDNNAPSQATLSYTVVAHSNSFGDSPQSNPVTCTTPAGCQVTTFSGDGTASYAEGVGTAAEWNFPVAETVAKDPVTGYNALFIADSGNARIRMVYLEGPNQGSSVLIGGNGTAGYGGGHGDAMNARFRNPLGIAAISDSNNIVTALIIADTDNNMIRKMTPPSGGPDWGIVDICGHWELPPAYVDGDSQTAQFSSPVDVAIGNDGMIYVADYANNAVRRVDLQGNTSTVANASSGLGFVTGITVSKTSGLLYVADQSSNAIWQVSTGGQVTSITTGLNKPYHLVWTSGDVLYIANRVANQVARMALGSAPSALAGTGVQGWLDGACTTVSQFSRPRAVAIGPSGEFYITDSGNNRIRRIQ